MSAYILLNINIPIIGKTTDIITPNHVNGNVNNGSANQILSTPCIACSSIW